MTLVVSSVGAPSAYAGTPAAKSVCANDCFVLTSVFIEGVTAYSHADLAPTYADNLAREVGLPDLVATASAITDRYRADGYFLSRAVIPEPAHFGGSAMIQVYEGYIGEVVVDGDGADAVRPLLAPLAGRRNLRLAELDRQLALAEDMPGFKIDARLEPVIDDPAQHRLVVTAAIDRTATFVSLDNHGAKATGPWQAYGEISLNSTFRAGDALSFGLLTVPDRPRELVYGELAYSFPTGQGGRVRAALSGYKTHDETAPASGWLGGASMTGSVSWSYPLVIGRRRAVWSSVGLDVRKVQQDWRSVGQYDETLSVVRLALSGQREWTSGYVTGSLTASQGVDLFGSTQGVSTRHSRRDADSDFLKANLNASVYQDLGDHAGIFAAVSGQWSNAPLLASEEFSVGAAPYGRAYNYGEISGDDGLAGAVEVRFGWNPASAAISFVQAYSFVDGGAVWNDNALGGRTRTDLSSAGAGLRLTFDDKITLKLEAAKPLDRIPYGEADRGWRPFIGLSAKF